MKVSRRYPRQRESVLMSVMPTGTGEARTYVTRDISVGGIFLYAKASEQLPVGTELLITPLRADADLMPSVPIKGRVVRVSPQGMGIEFSEPISSRPD
jgi:hypothetical protein